MERMDSLVGREMPKFVTLSWIIVIFAPGDKEPGQLGQKMQIEAWALSTNKSWIQNRNIS